MGLRHSVNRYNYTITELLAPIQKGLKEQFHKEIGP